CDRIKYSEASFNNNDGDESFDISAITYARSSLKVSTVHGYSSFCFTSICSWKTCVLSGNSDDTSTVGCGRDSLKVQLNELNPMKAVQAGSATGSRLGYSIPSCQHIAERSPGQPDNARPDYRIDGFHLCSRFTGHLGRLGRIPDKYDVAVSTSCGALNNMVVDTVARGKACNELLRKQNIGRAS
ncbi:hypothetical protein K503DRAFT_786652, partial [Rhizopogon vinicolor AM-OR11-026]